MIELEVAEKWLYASLTGDVELVGLLGGDAKRIHSAGAPYGAVFPAVIYQFQGGADVRTADVRRVMGSLLYLVKAVGQGASFAPVNPLAARIDRVLDRRRGAGGDGLVLGCTREQPFSLAETSDGVSYRHRGGIYRLYAQQGG